MRNSRHGADYADRYRYVRFFIEHWRAQMAFHKLPLVWGLAAVLAGGLLFVSNASASVINTLLTGSTGTETISLNSEIFNNDPAAGAICTTTLGRGCNSDVSTNTTLSFIGGPLAVGEGVYVNNNDLT